MRRFFWVGLNSGEDQIFILCYDCVGVAFKNIIHRTFHHYQLNRFRDWWYYFPRLLSISSSILTQFWCSISHLWPLLMIEIVHVPSYVYVKYAVKHIYSNYVMFLCMFSAVTGPWPNGQYFFLYCHSISKCMNSPKLRYERFWLNFWPLNGKMCCAVLLCRWWRMTYGRIRCSIIWVVS